MNREIQTAVQLANMSLRMVQSPEIESFDEGSSVSRTVKMYYNNVLSDCLTLYDWSFSKKEGELTELSVCPLERYKHGYELPVDMLALTWVRGSGGITNYTIVSGNILCTDDPPPIFVRYTYIPPVAYMPAYFIDLFVHSLAEELSPVLGYNLDGQRVFRERIWGKHGKFGMAVEMERSSHGMERCPGHDLIGGSRIW
jgi:hypothetical protein